MKKVYKNRYILDFVATVMFFTRIPIKWSFFSNEAPDLTKAAWAFPLIGYLIGFCSGIFGDLCLFLGLPTLISCVISVIISILLTGALHEDGLADMADGFGAGGSPERINEIMHDSRLGTYGVIALISSFFARIGITLGLVEYGYSLTFILCAGFATGKLAIIISRNIFKASDFAKSGSIIRSVSYLNYISAFFIWLIPIIIIFPFWSLIFGLILVLCLIYFFGKKYISTINGITGDILGSSALLSELLFLFGILIIVGRFY